MAAAFARDVATVHTYGNDCAAIASEHGFAQWAAWGRILQGWADAKRGEATTGIDRIRDGLAASEATGTRANTPLHLALLAEALALAGKIEQGLAALDDALATAAASGATGWSAEIHRLRGEFAACLPYPDPAKAEESFHTALAIAREQGTRGYELRSPRPARTHLRLVHRRLRHARPNRLRKNSIFGAELVGGEWEYPYCLQKSLTGRGLDVDFSGYCHVWAVSGHG
jgi:predicted ATPase